MKAYKSLDALRGREYRSVVQLKLAGVHENTERHREQNSVHRHTGSLGVSGKAQRQTGTFRSSQNYIEIPSRKQTRNTQGDTEEDCKGDANER